MGQGLSSCICPTNGLPVRKITKNIMSLLKKKSSPFANVAYTKLFAAQVISLAGTGVTTIALALLAWQLAEAKAGQVLGTALALKMVAYVFLSPLVASVAHKIQRRTWLVVSDIARALLIFYLPFVTAVWEIYVILFLVSAFSAGFTPVFQATIADIIKEEKAYRKALSYSRLAYDLEQLLSPSLSALLLAFISFHELFLFDAASFFVAAILVLSAKFPNTMQTQNTNKFWENLKFGTRAYLKTPRLRALLAMYVAVASASAVMITGTVVYVSDVLGKNETHTAIAMAVSGFGSMIVSLALPYVLEKIQVRYSLLLGGALLFAGLLTAAVQPNWILFLVIWFFLGAGLAFIQVPAGSLVRMSCNPNDAVAYFSAQFSLSHFFWMLAYPLSGYLSSWFSMPQTFFIMGVLSFLSFLFSWKMYPNPDPIEIEHTHQKMTHEHFHTADEHHKKHKHNENEKDKQHTHLHHHEEVTHKHKFVIDLHHQEWPY